MRGRAGIAETSATGVVLVAALAFVGLGGGGVACGPGDTCPNDEPASCPSPIPSFSGQVQAIFETKCGACHAPGGLKADTPLLTWAQISPPLTRTSVLVRIVRCEMPKAGAPPLTEDERLALLGWLVCGGPNN
jgi:mono/diheme cytochrome c family protein